MATVNYVDAQFAGGTVRFQILPPADEIERLALCGILKPSLRDVYDRLTTGTPIDNLYQGDIGNVLMLAYAGEMFPLRGADALSREGYRAKIDRGRPWYSVANQLGIVTPPLQAAYRGLAVLILQAYLFGIESSAATWGPAAS